MPGRAHVPTGRRGVAPRSGALVALLGAASVLLLDACSYIVALILVATFLARPPASHAPTDRSTRASLRHIPRNTTFTRTIAGLALVELSFTALIATLPVVTRVRFDGGAALAGWLLASYGAGSVAGGLLPARARSVDDRTATLAIAGLAVSTWPLVAPLPDTAPRDRGTAPAGASHFRSHT